MTQAKKNSCQSTLREEGRGMNGVGEKRDDGWMEWEEWKERDGGGREEERGIERMGNGRR